MEWLKPIIIVPVIFFFFYKMIELFVHRRERINFIEKLGSTDMSKNSNIELGKIFGEGNGNQYWPLRIGGLIIGMGLGLLISYFIIYAIGFEEISNYNGDQIGIIYGAGTLLFGGAGLLGAFLVEKKLRNKTED